MLRLSSCLTLWLAFVATAAQEPRPGTAVVPKTWDDGAIATLEVPLANPLGSPKHASSDYYYRIPVAPIYKNYPVYVPGREPAGYFERLTQQAPEVVWDDAGHRPPLNTEADWIRAGELVFDAPVKSGLLMSVDDVRNPAWYAKVGWMAAADGTFTIRHLPPGEYKLNMHADRPEGVENGATSIVLNGANLENVTVTTSSGWSATGRVTTENGTTPDMRPNRIRIVGRLLTGDAEPRKGGGNPESGRVKDDWTFAVTRLYGPARLRASSAPFGGFAMGERRKFQASSKSAGRRRTAAGSERHR
jgi:hypothetical protein